MHWFPKMWLDFDIVHRVCVVLQRAAICCEWPHSVGPPIVLLCSFACLLVAITILCIPFSEQIRDSIYLCVCTKMHEMFIFGFLCRCYIYVQCALRFPLVYVKYTNFNCCLLFFILVERHHQYFPIKFTIIHGISVSFLNWSQSALQLTLLCYKEHPEKRAAAHY